MSSWSVLDRSKRVASLVNILTLLARPHFNLDLLLPPPSLLLSLSHALHRFPHCADLRREDFDFIAPKTPEYDVLQCNSAPSVATPRGHQFPAAFMIVASGLDKHGADSTAPIAYTHCDIGGAAVAAPFADGAVTGQPVTSLVGRFVLNL